MCRWYMSVSAQRNTHVPTPMHAETWDAHASQEAFTSTGIR